MDKSFYAYKQLLKCGKYLKIHDLLPYRTYNIFARNARCGIWMPERDGFMISGWKYDRNYCFVELHWDADSRFGTVKPFVLHPTPIRFEPQAIMALDEFEGDPAMQKQVMNYLNALEHELSRDNLL